MTHLHIINSGERVRAHGEKENTKADYIDDTEH